MRGDVEIADARPVGQGHRHRRRLRRAGGAGFRGGARSRRRRGRRARGRASTAAREFLRAIVVEQGEQPGGVRRGATRRARPGARRACAIAGTARRRRSRALDGLACRVAASKPVEMRRVLDRWPGVVAARVPRDLVGAGDDAARWWRWRAASAGRRTCVCGNRVAIAVEAHVRRLPETTGAHARRSRRDGRAAARAAAAPARRPAATV